jgi:hypothetical protein
MKNIHLPNSFFLTSRSFNVARGAELVSDKMQLDEFSEITSGVLTYNTRSLQAMSNALAVPLAERHNCIHIELILKSYARADKWDLLRFWQEDNRRGHDRLASNVDPEMGLWLLGAAIDGYQCESGMRFTYSPHRHVRRITLNEVQMRLKRGETFAPLPSRGDGIQRQRGAWTSLV